MFTALYLDCVWISTCIMTVIYNAIQTNTVIFEFEFTVCVPTGYYHGHFNIAMFPTACTDSALDDRKRYPTLVRCLPTLQKIGRAFGEIFREFKWIKMAIYAREFGQCQYGAEAINDELQVGVHLIIRLFFATIKNGKATVTPAFTPYDELRWVNFGDRGSSGENRSHH